MVTLWSYHLPFQTYQAERGGEGGRIPALPYRENPHWVPKIHFSLVMLL